MPRRGRRTRRMRGGDGTPAPNMEYGGDGVPQTPTSMTGGSSMLAGAPVTGVTTSGQAGAASTMHGGAYQMIVPAALVLANNAMGRGRSLRYKGKGAFRGKTSRYSRGRYSRRRRGSRRR